MLEKHILVRMEVLGRILRVKSVKICFLLLSKETTETTDTTDTTDTIDCKSKNTENKKYTRVVIEVINIDLNNKILFKLRK